MKNTVTQSWGLEDDEQNEEKNTVESWVFEELEEIEELEEQDSRGFKENTTVS